MVTTPGPIGRPVRDLDTPALVVDLSVMEGNMARMARVFKEARVNWRPHIKSIKVPAIAHQLIAVGAVGVTCAKLGEAEVMASAGIRDILISNQIVGEQKVARLIALCRHADPIVAVDSLQNVRELDDAARQKGVRLRVVVEVNVGLERCGVEPGEPVVILARAITTCPGLQFVGVMTWEGHIQRVAPEQKAQAVEQALSLLTGSANACRTAGLPVQIVSCGGTADYWLSAGATGVTENQAGGGVFGDRYYQSKGVDHPIALTVLSTVTSRPNPTRIVTDAGRKAMSVEEGAMPWPRGIERLKSIWVTVEHGRLELVEPSSNPRIGDKLEWLVGSADTTVFLHDEMYGVRDGVVETVWPVLARGKIR